MIAAWYHWLGGTLATFAALMGISGFWSLMRWRRLRSAGTPLGLKTFFRLRWLRVNVGAFARAHWAAIRCGHPPQLDLLESLALVGVNLDRLAGALETAEAGGLKVKCATLGVLAMAGYDPVDAVEAAVRHGYGRLGDEDLARLEQWGVRRHDRPV